MSRSAFFWILFWLCILSLVTIAIDLCITAAMPIRITDAQTQAAWASADVLGRLAIWMQDPYIAVFIIALAVMGITLALLTVFFGWQVPAEN